MSLKKIAQSRLSRSLYRNAYSRALYTLFGTVIKEIRVAFLQFFSRRYPIRSLFRTLSVIFSSIIRIALGRNLKYSFAFAGEDKIIEGLLKPIISQNGCYVDVGCNHPVFLSNTYGLYRKGWRGLCIDANPDLIKKYPFFRPKDIAVQALVSESPGSQTFYISENAVLSTVEKSNLQHPDHAGLKHRAIRLEAKSLSSILDEHKVPFEFDLLSIDAEEHDLSVLKSLDFNRYAPKLIVVEDETFDLRKIGENKIYALLIRHRYELVAYVLKNLYFLKVDKPFPISKLPIGS